MTYAPNDDELRARIADYNRENPRPRTNGAAPLLEVVSGGATERKPESKIKLVPFDEINLGTERGYLVKGLIPRTGCLGSAKVRQVVLDIRPGDARCARMGISRQASAAGTGGLLRVRGAEGHRGAQ